MTKIPVSERIVPAAGCRELCVHRSKWGGCNPPVVTPYWMVGYTRPTTGGPVALKWRPRVLSCFEPRRELAGLVGAERAAY